MQTMNGKLRIGILGAGSILGAHVSGFVKLKDQCSVVAVAKAHPEQAEEVRALLGPDVPIEGDYRKVLAMDDVDAVDILLPHDMHVPATIEAARAGKHVLVEKVMARNVRECDSMIQACEQAGVSLTVCHDRRYDPNWMALKSVLDAGLLGEVYYWKLEHNQNVELPPGHWIRDRDRLGGGAVMSCLTHQIDGLRWYGGEIESVTCMTKAVPRRMEGEAFGVVVARMHSGALAHLSINWMTRSGQGGAGKSLWFELIHATGSQGEAYYMTGRGSFLMLYDRPERAGDFTETAEVREGEFFKLKGGDWTGHQRCIAEWVRMLRGQESEISTSGRAVRGTVEAAEAAYISEQTGRTVQLPLPPVEQRALTEGT